MKTKPSTEYVLLGALFLGPKHGYEIMQFLESALESTWQVSTSQLYVLLKRLEHDGLLESNLETQETRPSKRVFSLTSKGKKAFLEWLRSPVEHIRDLRIEFLAKLFFFQSFSLKGGNELIKAQITSLKDIKGKLQKKNKRESEAFRKLVFEIKLMTIETWQEWLHKKAKPFMRQVRTHDGCIR
ncbi:MAG: PadR family transcriptional regulator [Desulfobacteraceae bacterium]|jgi:DNA-binding PadR family transcriptional regulator|nr:PadR family transcriptional regulator [Desulfobacteraceae bacterium]